MTHAYDHCPTCAYALTGTSVASTRQVIDLPPPAPVEVVDHQVIKRWCPCCARYQTPSLADAGVALGRGRIGVRLASLIAYLRTTLRLPLASIQQYLATIHTCTLSIGGIQQVLDAVATALTPTVTTLKQAARASPILHADETGWRQNGQNGYIWCFTTPGDATVRYYEYDRSRAHTVVKRVLDGQFDGHLVSDFYAAYNDYAGRHQRCWVHLLRDLHDLRTAPGATEAVVTWVTAVEETYRTARAWCAAPSLGQAAVASRR